MDGSAAHFKHLIRAVVDLYKRTKPREYELLCDAIRLHRAALKDPKFGTGDGDGRGIFEISEELQTAIIMALPEEGITWFNTKDGGRWFANTFKEFALPDHI